MLPIILSNRLYLVKASIVVCVESLWELEDRHCVCCWTRNCTSRPEFRNLCLQLWSHDEKVKPRHIENLFFPFLIYLFIGFGFSL